MKITRQFLRVLSFTLLALAATPLLRAGANDAPPARTVPAAPSPLAAARAASAGDPLLEALLTELERSKSQLKMDQVAAPYYIEYRVHELERFAGEAAFGALREDQHLRARILRVVVRVGDYKEDSFFGQGGMGETQVLPLDDDPIALRHQIWLATDAAYKAAGEALTQKQASMKQFAADPNPVDDFAKAPAAQSVGARASVQYDATGWRKTLEDVTNLYRQYPDLQSLTASAQFDVVNEYFVNTEGTVTRSGRTTYTVTLNGSTQAADGMRLSRNPYWTVGRPNELPTHEALLAETKKMLDTLMALRNAPIVEEEYRGPVLFAPDAADDMIASLIGGNILGRKPRPGQPNRTAGGFGTSWKARVLPAFLTVVDDPTMKEFQGQSVLGSYDVDSEGVRAQTITLIDKGILTNYLLGRQPIRDFPTSNGHGRAAPGTPPQPSIGTLILRSAEAQPAAAVKQQMVEMVRNQGKPYAYRVETLGPGNAPRLLYRIYEKDGHEEMVRGAVFSELDLRSMRSDVIAVGDDALLSNRAGGAPTSVICPSVLFDELEVKRADTSKDKLPDYPPPPLTAPR